MKKTIFFVSMFTCFALSGNLFAQKTVCGEYSGSYYYDNIKLNINENGRYELSGINFHLFSEGNWHMDGSRLILNSDTRELLYEVDIKPGAPNKRIVNVNLHGEDINSKEYIARPYRWYAPLFYHPDRGSYVFGMGGSIKEVHFEIEKAPLSRKWVGMPVEEYILVKTKPIEVESELGDEVTIDILIEDELFQYIILSDFRIKIRNNKLIFKHPFRGDRIVLHRKQD